MVLFVRADTVNFGFLRYYLICADLVHITGMGHGGTMGFNLQNTTSDSNPNRSSSAIGSDILDRTVHDLKLEKSNILLLGPTGSGKYFAVCVIVPFHYSIIAYLCILIELKLSIMRNITYFFGSFSRMRIRS